MQEKRLRPQRRNVMLRRLGIALTVIALGMTSIQTDAFARGGRHRGGSGGGGHIGAPGYVGVDRGAVNSRAIGLRLHDRGRLQPGFGNDPSWSGPCFSHPYSYRSNCDDGSFF
jgi:hypothetical protein